MKNEISTIINVKDKEVKILRVDGIDYISLTDIAKIKNLRFPADVIKKWMSNKNSFDFYNLWEKLSNENFNLAESRQIEINEASKNSFVISATQ